MKRITVLFCFLLSIFFTYGQEVTIGTGTVSMRQPLSSYHGYSRSAALYTSAEINQVGFINKLAWDIGEIKGDRPVKIYLKEVESEALVAGNWNSFIDGAVVVYEGGFIPGSVGYNTINLHTSFNYTGGVKNLLVLVETNFGGSGNNDGVNGLKIKATAATNMHFQAGTDTTAPTTNLSATAERPNLKITFGPEITCLVPTNLVSEANAGTSFTVNWTARTGVTNYDLYLSTTSTTPTADATVVPVTGTTHTFEGLTESTQYYVWVRSHCSDTEQSSWIGPLAIKTGLIPMSLPYSENFEGEDVRFGFTNHTNNKWYIGTAVNHGGTKSLYISKDGGTTNEYNPDGAEVSQAFKDIAIPAGTTNININFDWRCKGEGFTTTKYDYFRVWAVPVSYTPTAGTQITAATDRIRLGRAEYNDEATFVNENIVFDASAFAGQSMRLVFEWRQDFSGGNQPPAAIDNLTVAVVTCNQPTALTLGTLTGNSIQINWTAAPGVTNYDVYIGTTPDRPAADATVIPVTGTTHTFEGLTPLTQYYIWLRSHCSDTDQSLWAGLNVSTGLVPVAIPYTEDFETEVAYGYTNDTTNKWHIGTAVSNGGTKSLYISKDNGTTYEYQVAGAQVSHSFKDFTIPAGTTELVMNFDWRCVGETSEVDYFRVWVVPVNFTPTAGTQVTAGTNRTRVGRSAYNGNNVFLNENVIVNATAFAGQTMRVVFEWRQDGSGGTQPPAAIDNLKIKQYTCRDVAATSIQTSNITTTGGTVTWTGTAASYDLYITQGAESPIATTAPTTNVTAATHAFNNLNPGTQYLVWIRSNCGTDDQSAWTGPVILATDMTPVTLPYTEDFEGVTNFEYKKNGTVNKWFVGNAVHNQSQKALYISENFGRTHTYNFSGAQVAHVYKDFVIPADASSLAVNFDWISNGEGFTATTFYDYFRVWAVPASFIPTAGTQISAAADRIQLGRPQYNNKTTFERERLEVAVNAFAGQTMRLVFEWRQDGSGGNQPPAAIDNLEVSVVACSRPTNVELVDRTNNTITIAWTAITGQDTYEVFYSTTNTAPGETITGSVTTTENPYTIQGLTANETYYVWIRTVCSPTEKSTWVSLNDGGVRTGQYVPGELPYEDGFEGDNNWTIISNSLNKWIVGTAVNNGGTKSLYVTKDNGVTNTYSNNTSTVTHAYRDIAIPVNALEARLSFDWRAKGESCCDYIRVWVVPVVFDPVQGTQIAAGTNRIQIGRNYNVQENFTEVIEGIDVRNYAGRSLRLVFEWRNDGSSGDDPAGAIDNVKLEQIDCPRVTGLTACAASEHINFGWDSQEGMTQWEVALETTDLAEPDPANIIRVDVPEYTATGLTVNEAYYFYVRNICAEGVFSMWRKIVVRTNSTNLLDANPFCAGPGGIIFPNNNRDNTPVEFPLGDNLRIACLGSVPYPVWYFLKIDTDGDLVFDIIQSTSFDANGEANGDVLDVDFVAFGPFNDLEEACAESVLGPCPAGVDCPNNTSTLSNYPVGNIVDCSYDGRNIETLTINGARRGQIYAVLITNFGRRPGFIKLAQRNVGTPGAGTTDCKFLCEVDLGEDQYLCPGSSYEIKAKISAAGSTEDMTYTWFKDGEMLDPTLFNTNKLVVTESGTYRVRVEKDLCEENPEDEVVIKIYEPISLRLPEKIELCDLENVGYAMFDIKTLVEGAIANNTEAQTIKHRYYHTLEDFNAKRNAFEIDDLYQSEGNESIFVEVYRDKNEDCRGYAEIMLRIKATVYFNAEFSYEGPICINNIEELPITPGAEFTPGGKFTYKTISHTKPKDPTKEPKGGLSLNSSTGAIDVAASIPGVYEVSYYYGVPSNMCGDPVEHKVTITIFERFEIALDGDCYDGNYYMRVIDVLDNIDDDSTRFEWTGPGGFTADTKEITVSKEGDYTVYVETKDGCYEEQTITLKADEINCLITKGISPNGDGLNDFFDLSNYKVLSFKVFNRNGGEVYTHGLGYTTAWGGQDKSGNKLPSGTYFYVIETVQKTITGWVQINY
ncbi:fibronectin type III domain-containing protein [Myroides odoratus]|uniref:fibronectin type III domain-containing protein n=1 Tax=Myroides odoratus TaxID=256 RepID=UPI000765AACC|nr:fibronectin type III domain-containing protein [Myroides odoratus]